MIPKIPSSGIWAAYAVHTLAVMAAIFISGYFPDHAPGGFINPLIGPESYMADKLIKWDAHWYTYVAEEGYTAQSIVFFPMIIILIKGLAAFGISYAKAGLLVCNIFAAFSFWALYRLFTLDNSRNVAFRAILVYGLMPTSFFFEQYLYRTDFYYLCRRLSILRAQGMLVAVGIFCRFGNVNAQYWNYADGTYGD